jgi:hypothetical protein
MASHKCTQQGILKEMLKDIKKLLEFKNKMIGIYIAFGFIAGIMTFFGTIITILKFFDKDGAIARMILQLFI